MCNLDKNKVSEEEISLATKILEKLVANPVQLFEMDEQKRIELIKFSGQLSRPNRQEFTQRKKNAKRRLNEKEEKEKSMHVKKLAFEVLEKTQFLLLQRCLATQMFLFKKLVN